MALTTEQLSERLRRNWLARQDRTASQTGMGQLPYQNPSYVGNIGLGGFSASPNAGDYTMADAATEETDPAKVAADIMSGDSKLMRAAETRGLQSANKRGLINSSIAVGAAQDEVLSEVVPLASQEAQQRFESNRARQDFGLGSMISRQEYEQRLSEADQGFGFDMGLLEREGQINLERDERNFGYESDLEQMRLDYARDEAALDRDFDRETQLLDIDARFDLADMDADIRRELMQMETDMRFELQAMENSLDARNITADAFLTARDQYNQRVTNIMNNPDLSDEERRAAIAAEQANLAADIQTIEDLYTIDLPWTDDYVPDGVDTANAQEVRAEISGFYTELLGREADRAGLTFYENKVTSGEMTLSQVRAALMQSAEAQNGSSSNQQSTGTNRTDSRSIVQTAYQSVLGREADSGGLNYWSQLLQAGRITSSQLYSYLRSSDEGRGLVRYDATTGRLVPVQQSTSGSSSSTRTTTSGTSGTSNTNTSTRTSNTSSQTSSNTSGSSNSSGSSSSSSSSTAGKTADGTTYTLALKRAYYNTLGRLPDSAGYTYWLGMLNSGRMTIDQVTAALANSDEGRGLVRYNFETKQLEPV